MTAAQMLDTHPAQAMTSSSRGYSRVSLDQSDIRLIMPDLSCLGQKEAGYVLKETRILLEKATDLQTFVSKSNITPEFLRYHLSEYHGGLIAEKGSAYIAVEVYRKIYETIAKRLRNNNMNTIKEEGFQEVSAEEHWGTAANKEEPDAYQTTWISSFMLRTITGMAQLVRISGIVSTQALRQKTAANLYNPPNPSDNHPQPKIITQMPGNTSWASMELIDAKYKLNAEPTPTAIRSNSVATDQLQVASDYALRGRADVTFKYDLPTRTWLSSSSTHEQNTRLPDYTIAQALPESSTPGPVDATTASAHDQPEQGSAGKQVCSKDSDQIGGQQTDNAALAGSQVDQTQTLTRGQDTDRNHSDTPTGHSYYAPKALNAHPQHVVSVRPASDAEAQSNKDNADNPGSMRGDAVAQDDEQRDYRRPQSCAWLRAFSDRFVKSKKKFVLRPRVYEEDVWQPGPAIHVSRPWPCLPWSTIALLVWQDVYIPHSIT
ncbi:hypothetical protein BU25DRAFT_449379 [Macroventuria anomochaeta]|uniref:Uncharacterized protein n=1 Tax=Macroventuria anomochaeta TaxID=301207 RepID=A0ACB6RWT0_9PLEO|nr:uncharacterized protein BU25DRAFT_449379 [Macroventuria anomochaeta]KAF2626430.1 hypothetical protein BU25DRAFT_449379 [Macroventuria anomochaeta]